MYDRVSNLGYQEIQASGLISAGGASGSVFNLITTQAQGRVAFVMDATANNVNGGTQITYLQTSSDNGNWTNLAYPNGNQAIFTTVTNVANTAGLQTVFIDSSQMSQYNRSYTAITGTNANFSTTIVAVYVPKNA